MKINPLNQRQGLDQNAKLNNAYTQLQKLLNELSKKELSDGVVTSINQDIEEVNATSNDQKELRKLLRKKQTSIMKLVEKELKLVPKNYYRNLWLAIGMSAFGIPLGLAMGLSLGSMAFIGIGLPIGLAVGIAIGTSMDKKALEEGRQLDFEFG